MSMKGPESELERQFCRLAGEHGGRAEKLVLLGENDFPDRTVMLPGAIIGFAELKAPGERMTPGQRQWMTILQAFGFPCGCYDNIEACDRFFRKMKGEY